MTTHCEKCGAEIEAGWTVCRKCFEPVKRPGLLARLWRFFSGMSVSVGKVSGPAGGTKVNLNISEKIRIQDARTGEEREYRSLDDVPPEWREKIRQVQESVRSGKTVPRISITDSSGVEHTYNSPDEMPPELRAVYEKAQRSGS